MAQRDIKEVGNWLYGTLSPIELKKIIEHNNKAIEPADKVILDIQISLFELEALKLYGHMLDKRNCFELYPRIERTLALEGVR